MADERSQIEHEIGVLSTKISVLRYRRRQLEIREGRYARALSPRTLAIKAAYVANECSVTDVALAFNTSAGFVQRLARELAWPRRSPLKCKSQLQRRRKEAA